MDQDDQDRRRGPTSQPATTPDEQRFARRALIAVGIAVGVTALALFLWYAMYVLLLAFAAVLVGVLLRGGAEWVARRLRIGVGWALGLVVLSLAGIFVLFAVFAAPSIVQQVEHLADRLPQSLRKAEDTIRRYPWGRRVLDDQSPDPTLAEQGQGGQDQGGQDRSQQGQAGQDQGGQEQGGQDQAGRLGSRPATQQPYQPATGPASQPASQPTSQPGEESSLAAKVVEAGTGPQVVQRATRLANRVLQGLVALFVVLISGIYLAAQPRMYVKGLLILVPHARRPRYRQVLDRLAFTIRWWMIGQLVPMVVIGILTAVGLKLIGIELWLILGLLAAVLNFIPNFGPIIAGTPAFLLALAESPTKALWVVALFVCAQSLEGYVLTPLVQRKAVELPPALLILFQVLAGLLLGALGVVLAAPLLAVMVVAAKMLYVEDVMGDDARVLGKEDGAKVDSPAPVRAAD